MTHQCYYCGQTLDSRELLYDHLATHTTVQKYPQETVRIENEVNIQTPDVSPKDVSEQHNPNSHLKATDVDIDLLKKRVEEIQKRIKSI
jgi:hypothetical protein